MSSTEAQTRLFNFVCIEPLLGAGLLTPPEFRPQVSRR
jgi:hypothetical protein